MILKIKHFTYRVYLVKWILKINNTSTNNSKAIQKIIKSISSYGKINITNLYLSLLITCSDGITCPVIFLYVISWNHDLPNILCGKFYACHVRNSLNSK